MISWRGYTIERLQTESPFAAQKSKPARDVLEEDENHSQDEVSQAEGDFDYVVTDEWKERLKSSAARIRDRRKRQKSINEKLSVLEKIERLRDELRHGFQQAMERLQEQQQQSVLQESSMPTTEHIANPVLVAK